MSQIPEDLRYTRDSEWIRMDDEFNATCGITDQIKISPVKNTDTPGHHQTGRLPRLSSRKT